MKIVIAPQGFKGSMDAPEVAECIARGVRQIFPQAELVVLPVADGGEGTVRALVQSSGGETVTIRVTGPLGSPVNATWGVLGDGRTAVIEMAAASGLPLLARRDRNPMRTTSYGTGELIRDALHHGLRDLIVGLGGSATNDGGVGMMQALGVHFLDAQGQELRRGGGALRYLDRIDVTHLDPRLGEAKVMVASDVNNPLTGPTGASHIYGPQKGADARMVHELDESLGWLAGIIARDLGKDVRDVPGAGAAGGVGAALLAFCQAEMCPGYRIVFDALKLQERLQGADLLVTGEGRMDGQDVYGKAPMEAAKLAKRLGIPSIAITGSTGRDYRVVYEHGLDAVIGTTNRPMPLDRAVAESARLITEAAMRACRLVLIGMNMSREEDAIRE